MPAKYNHRKYYSAPQNKKMIGKYQIKNGMIVTFKYQTTGDKAPLVFVMDTDEFTRSDKKSFSGINLNYFSQNA